MSGVSSRLARCGELFTFVLLLLAPFQSALGQSSWDRYKPGTLASIMAAHDSVIRASWRGGRPSEHFSGDNYPTLATVLYLGDSRPIDPNRLSVIRRWGKAFMRDSTIADDFHREYLFQEGALRLWLPVQDTVASFFPRELRAGQPVKLFVSWLGAHYEGREITWAFVVNEFEAAAIKP
jgi:hypothetical protein